jgi:CRP-like cAMP-binding protein
MKRTAHDLIALKLKAHSHLSSDDVSILNGLVATVGHVRAGEDIVRQGDRPTVAIVVLSGMLGRYHALPNGGRQYLTFHIAGDMPDAQSLFLKQMDHSLCAMDDANVATIPHTRIFAVFTQRPLLAYAMWRETLIDAAIFRAAITNNSAREPVARVAHFLAEQYFRASIVKLTSQNACAFPLTQQQVAETLGMSLVTASRAFRALRETGAMELRERMLLVRDWKKLAAIGQFDEAYLHQA